MLGGDRDAAEQTAHDLVQRLETNPVRLNGNGASARVALAYAVISLTQSGVAGNDRAWRHFPRQTPPRQGADPQVSRP